MRVVLGSNIVVSAIVFGGKPEEVVDLARTRKIRAVYSEPMLSEVLRILEVKFGFSKSRLQTVNKLFSRRMTFVTPEQALHVLADDPDNRILEAAVAGNCDHIVTGDKPLLALGKYKNIEILSVNEFLKLYSTKEK